MEFFIPVDPLDDVRRLYRQACLHRLANETSAAAKILQEQLPDHVARLQAGDQEGRWTREVLQSAFEEEYRRVVDAHVVGEWVFSRLQTGSQVPFASVKAAPVAAPVAEPVVAARRPAPAVEPGGQQSITDMLDSMLAQDRPRKTRA
jgi:hypothetical protein